MQELNAHSDGSIKKQLNDEVTADNRDYSYKDDARNARNDSRSRKDVDSTTDPLAALDMLEYVKTDSVTLDMHKESLVASFYAKRSILITGASGFVGKCLLEKLLRSCPDIENIFILMRPKRGLDVGERVESLFQSAIFNRLRDSTHGAEQMDKVKAVKGDITKPNFGLSDIDIETLVSKVSVVIHSAATVRFVEPLKVAIENNLVSVDNLVNLATKFQKLETLVHVSTAYSNCDREEVAEIFYESPINGDKLIDMSKWMNEEMFENLTDKLIRGRPNTYTYTKAVAENILLEKSKKLLPNIPIAMIRPSIVAGTWKQPIRGWVDNFNGPTGVILSMMTGAIQGMLARPDYCADIIPVDIVANLIICAAYEVHHQHNKPLPVQPKPLNFTKEGSITVFNCVSGALNPVSWLDFKNYMQQVAYEYPPNMTMREPTCCIVPNEKVFSVFNFFNHTLWAYGVDMVLKIVGKKPKLVILHNRMTKMIQTLKPFTTKQWSFECSNMIKLYGCLTTIDQEIFNFDIRQLRWDDYLRRYYIGSKMYTLRDDPKDVVKARRKVRRMYFGNRIAKVVFLMFFYYILLSGSALEKMAVETIQSSVLGSLISLPQISY